MKKILTYITQSFVIFPLIMTTAFAQVTEEDESITTVESLYFTNQPITLTEQEKTSLAIVEKWQQGKSSKPLAGADGAVTFVFGVNQVSVICAALQVCDIQLQAGEVINSYHVGDTAQWLVDAAWTGQGDEATQHMIIKPVDAGLETNLIIATDRRTYNLLLRSDQKNYMPRVNFIYPEDALAKFAAMQAKEQAARQKQTLPETQEYLGDLSFEYDISGNASWKPVRVYNDGKKTILQMPNVMEQTEAPTLLVIREGEGWFSKDEEVLVNYRVQDDRFIVDTVFDEAILIAGVGNNQQRVTIIRES